MTEKSEEGWNFSTWPLWGQVLSIFPGRMMVDL